VIVVSGYHGFKNLGDEAILAVLCADLAALGVPRSEILVLSGDPDYTERTHGVPALDRYALKQIWQALGGARLLVSGGGSLFQDVTSRRSIPYYLSIVEMAFWRRVPVALYGHGIGPIGTPAYQRLVARVFRKSAGFTVRDAFSVQFLHHLKVPVPNEAAAVDPVFQLPASEASNGLRAVPTIGLNLRPYPAWRSQLAQWAEILQALHRAGWQVRFVPIGPGDEEMGKELRRQAPALELGPALGLDSFRTELSRLDVFISMRLHGVIFGALSGTVPVGLNYDPKIHAVCAQIGCRCIELVELGLLPRTIVDIVEHYALNQSEQMAQVAKLREIASRNREMLQRVLEG